MLKRKVSVTVQAQEPENAFKETAKDLQWTRKDAVDQLQTEASVVCVPRKYRIL